MNTYKIEYIEGEVPGDLPWEKIQKADINTIPWPNYPLKMPAFARVAYNEKGLFVQLSAEEERPLARFDSLLDRVCNDSCLEFFFCPSGDSRYFNFEFNPKGAMHLGFGTNRTHSIRQLIPSYRSFFFVSPFIKGSYWGIEFFIPISFLRIYYPSLNLEKSSTFRGNFYKCGDETEIPHYIVWNPVVTPNPDFHRPEYFGNLVLN